MHLFVCVCVCVCVLYKEDEKKNTYKWIRKDLLICPTNTF